MANGRNVLHPRPGVSLVCVDPLRCGDTHPQRMEGPFSLYGVSEAPRGFEYHDTQQCPAPRIRVFETLEDYWSQDFLRTFTDCLQASDFNTAAATRMNLLSVTSFAGSSRLTSHTSYSGSFSYQCCFFPSYYQANVRGLERSTPYYNPLFSSCHDYNCFEEESCMSYGQVNGRKRATPHSLQWYLLNSLAFMTDSGGNSSTFWNQHVVGNTHTTATVAAPLGISLVGASQATLASLTNLIGTHDKAASLQIVPGGACTMGDGASVYWAIQESQLFCPFSPNVGKLGFKGRADKSILTPYPTVSTVYTDISIQASSFFWNLYNTPPIPTDAFSNAQSLRVQLECCTRLDAGDPYTTLTTFSSQTGADQFGRPIYQYSLSNFRLLPCSPYMCPTSPICHNLLTNFCRSPASQTSRYCQRFFSWATSVPTPALAGLSGQYLANPILVNPGTPTLPTGLPQGAYNSGVDAALTALVGACSYSVWAGDTSSVFFKDMCSSLFSTTWQPNFPRLNAFQYGDPVTTTNNTVFNYNLTAQDAQVDIVLTYTAYSFTDNFTATNQIMDPNGNPNYQVLRGYNYLCMPILLTTTLASFNMLGPTETIDVLTQPNFISELQTRFNTSLITLNGRLNFPPAPTSSYTQVFEWLGPTGESPFGSAIGPQSITINPAYPDHSTDVVQWDPITNAIILTHTLNVTNTSSIADFRRQENINYLYSYSSLQTKNGSSSFTAFQNSSMDQYTWMTNYCGEVPCAVPSAGQIGPQGVANARFSANLVSTPILADTLIPTLSVQFSPKVLAYLNTPVSPTISINVLSQNEGRVFGFGVYRHFYSSTVVSGPAPTGSSIPTQHQFNITNTSPLTFTNLSYVNYDITRYGVTLSTTLLPPGATSRVTVNMLQLTNLQNPNLIVTPVLFYDSVSWQRSLVSPDFPVLGGFYIAQNFANNDYATPYRNNRFSRYVTDSVLESNGVSYLSNQNVYQVGEQAIQISTMKIIPLV